MELTNELYQQIILQYQKKGSSKDMKPLLPGALELPNDKYRFRIDELEAEVGTLTDKNASLSNENASLSSKNASLSNENAVLSDKNKSLEFEIAELRRKLEENVRK